MAANELEDLRASLHEDTLEVYRRVAETGLMTSMQGGDEAQVEEWQHALDGLVVETRLLEATRRAAKVGGLREEIELERSEREQLRKRAEDLGVAEVKPNGEWSLTAEADARSKAPERLRMAGIKPETVETFLGDADFLLAAAEVAEGRQPKTPYIRISNGRPPTVREIRFVGSELEALAADQMDLAKGARRHDVQYVVMSGALTPDDKFALGGRVKEIAEAIRAQPGKTYLTAVIALPDTKEGREAQKLADVVAGQLQKHLGVDVHMRKPNYGTFAKEVAMREAEFITRTKLEATNRGQKVSMGRGL